ncbi:MAG: phosphoribosyltransferase [Myxococcaceae bacterium]
MAQQDNQRLKSRADAGQKLAVLLAEWREKKPVVIGMSRGGVPVARELATAMDAPFHVIVVRRLQVPTDPERALGAIAEGDGRYFNTQLQQFSGVSDQELATLVKHEEAELSRLIALYRGGAPLPDLAGRTAILVDDGLVTGAAIRAALDALRKRSPKHLVVAAGVGLRHTVDGLRKEIGSVVCAVEPARVKSLSHFFTDFRPVTDADVIAALTAPPTP